MDRKHYVQEGRSNGHCLLIEPGTVVLEPAVPDPTTVDPDPAVICPDLGLPWPLLCCGLLCCRCVRDEWWMWLTAIVPLLCCRFWKPPCLGEVLLKFTWDTNVFVFFQGEASCLRLRAWLVTSRSSKVRHTILVLSYHGRRSRKPVRRLPFERDTVGNMHMFAYVYPYLFRIVHVLWTTRVCVHEFSCHVPLRSETEFRQHLPAVLRD